MELSFQYKFSWFGSYNESQRDALFPRFICKALYMFRTSTLSIIRSISTQYTLHTHASFGGVC
jgi:hypothetical protein